MAQEPEDEKEETTEEKKSPLLFYLGIGIGAILSVVLGAASGAYFGAKSVYPPYKVAEDIADIEEVVSEEITLVQGLDLAKQKSIMVPGTIGGEAIPSGLAVANVPGISRYFITESLEPERDRELTKSMVPRGFSDSQIEETMFNVSEPLSNAGGLYRSERFKAPGRVYADLEPGISKQPIVHAQDPRRPPASFIENTKRSTQIRSLEYNLYAVPEVGKGSEMYEAEVRLPSMRGITASPLESASRKRGAP